MIPRAYEFVQLNVFTRTPWTGNPLAVFTDARGLSDKSPCARDESFRNKPAPALSRYVYGFAAICQCFGTRSAYGEERISMAPSAKGGKSAQGSGTRTKGKGGGTSRQRARGGSQRGGGTRKGAEGAGVRARQGSGASGGGGGQRSTRGTAKSATQTGPRQASRHAPTKAEPARPTGLKANRENTGGADESGESRVQGEP